MPNHPDLGNDLANDIRDVLVKHSALPPHLVIHELCAAIVTYTICRFDEEQYATILTVVMKYMLSFSSRAMELDMDELRRRAEALTENAQNPGISGS